MFRRKVQQLDDILNQLLREQGLETPLMQKRLVDAWDVVMGPSISRYTGEKFINKVVRESRQLVQKLGREPTDEEIAEQLSWPVTRVKQVKNVAREPISLETPIGEEEDSSLGDFIEDKEVENPAIQTSYKLLQEKLKDVLSTLPKREQEVLKMRFGLDDGYSLTLEEVGLYFEVTRERIRQIEAKALRRLRHPRRASGLRDYIDT